MNVIQRSAQISEAIRPSVGECGAESNRELHREETVDEFARRLGLCKSTVSRKLHEPDCPIRTFTAIEGSTGRINSLCASPELETFMLKHKRKVAA